MSLIVASASSRRHELLGSLRLRFEVAPADIDEAAWLEGKSPADAALDLARAKAEAASRPESVVIAADTMVVIDGRVLGKPRDDDEAHGMLRLLRGRTHRVLTGVCVASPAGVQGAVVATDVTMRAYGDAEIAAYVATGDGRDKAGSYAIQDETLRPVDAVSGCWCNVMGLPLWTAYHLLRDAGLLAPRSPDRAYARCAACPLKHEAP